MTWHSTVGFVLGPCFKHDPLLCRMMKIIGDSLFRQRACSLVRGPGRGIRISKDFGSSAGKCYRLWPLCHACDGAPCGGCQCREAAKAVGKTIISLICLPLKACVLWSTINFFHFHFFAALTWLVFTCTLYQAPQRFEGLDVGRAGKVIVMICNCRVSLVVPFPFWCMWLECFIRFKISLFGFKHVRHYVDIGLSSFLWISFCLQSGWPLLLTILNLV